MKTRIGFVSNSSSTSFVLLDARIGDVATIMLDVTIEDILGWYYWDDIVDLSDPSEDIPYTYEDDDGLLEMCSVWKGRLQRALKKPDINCGVCGISFPTYSYKTYIIKNRNKIHVHTCNNIPWMTHLPFKMLEGDHSTSVLVNNNPLFFDVTHNKYLTYPHYLSNASHDITCPNKECFQNQELDSYCLDSDNNAFCSNCANPLEDIPQE